MKVLIEVPHERATMCRGCFCGGHAGALRAEASEVEGALRTIRSARVSLESCEGDEKLGAQVLDHGVGGAARAGGTANEPLGTAEEAFEHVRVRGDAPVVEADEQMLAVTLGEGREVIDEAARGGGEPRSRNGALELIQVGLESSLRLGGALGAIDSVRVGGDLAGDLAEDLGMSGDPPRQTDLVPIGSQGLGEIGQEGIPACGPPFFSASWTRA
jgi:hypothetical protein